MKIARNKAAERALWAAGIVILILYPLRHAGLGVDLWDAGYNYTNFEYPGLMYMDSMWYYSTWLAGQLGTFLTKLPFGGSMLGMNIYTGLLVSLIAVLSWVFAVKKLNAPAWIAFLGEILALSLCWAPSAILYNYLTYLLLLAGTLLLHQGLTTQRRGFLVAAGVALGVNVAVRFSNLPQAALIIAVWTYGWMGRKKFREILKDTGFCILGYVGAIAAYMLLMSALYGFSEYVQGIMRLFEMTETARDYAPSSMFTALFETYYESAYWLKRYLVLGAAEFVLIFILPRSWVKIKKALIIAGTLIVTVWLIQKGYCYTDYHIYESVFDPCVTLLILMIVMSAYLLVRKSVSREEKLMAVIAVVTVLITSLGSNNAVYSSINNLFLVMPWFLGVLLKFIKERKEIWYFPFQCLLTATACLLLVQGLRFGRTFVYEQATGGRNMDTVVSEVPVLRGIKTSREKAEALTGLYLHLQESGAADRECLLYGQIPGVAYYMELAPAMNVWSDLRSYTYINMKDDLQQVRAEADAGQEKPVIILNAGLISYVEEKKQGDYPFQGDQDIQKMELICTFMEEYGYEMTYENEKFAVYQ